MKFCTSFVNLAINKVCHNSFTKFKFYLAMLIFKDKIIVSVSKTTKCTKILILSFRLYSILFVD